MCDECGNTIIQQIKVVGSIGDITVNNGLTLTGSIIQWGGPLLHDTDITGARVVNLGTNGSRLTQGNIYASNQILLNYLTGGLGVSLSLTSSGATLTDTLASPKGLIGAADYSANYTNNTYIQKIYGDTHLGSKLLTSLVTNPGAGQDHYYLQWDNAAAKYTLVATGITVPGLNMQVLFNDAGALAANGKFLFDKATGYVTVGDTLTLGTSGVVGPAKLIQVQGSDTNISLTLTTKGNGNLVLGVDTSGLILLGQSGNSAVSRTFLVNGSQSNIDLRLHPKGTGVVYLGDDTTSGASRTLKVDSTSTDVSLNIKPKGAGSVILQTTGGGQVQIGDIGVAGTDFYISTISSSTNRNLRISSNGTGRVIVDGYAKITLPINDWNMDLNQVQTVTLLNVTPDKIREISVVIINDTSTNYIVFSNYTNGSVVGDTHIGIDGYFVSGSNTVIHMNRRNGGDFDSINFDSTSFNRGFVTVTYMP